NLTINGMDINGSATKNITVMGSAFTQQLVMSLAGNTNAGVLIDSSTFSNISVTVNDQEGRLHIIGSGAGVKISNNYFSGGCSDGIRVDANGVEVGPGNEFTGIMQAGCDPLHVDPLQFYGGNNVNIHDNYFHDNSTGIMGCDGGSGELIANNVFANTGYNAVCAAHMPGLVITHNTLLNNGEFRIDDTLNTASSTTPTTVTFRDNIGGLQLGGGGNPCPCVGGVTKDHNMYTGASSPDINGVAKFVGGVAPTTMAGFALAAGSPGIQGASDGTNVGRVFSSSPTPPSPTPTPTPPPPSPTPTPTPTPVPAPPPPSPTPIPKQGDINGDNAVNIFDLSILLSNYGKPRAQASNPKADINNNNTVDIFDLSILLSKYGT
ncbi:MAG TPA: right-handed parallel beta-helix repeat-containing protein, partial [Candidatus Polarisedimenticolaceae bacterium]|nr:right-handed parallel beta-helix repeat-containing protein [Candidatus Polarisedimenticolaceae bacterium]